MVLLREEQIGTSRAGRSTLKLECDYDSNPTVMYQAIEAKQWDHVLNLFKAASLNDEKRSLGAEQAGTWVVRKEGDGRLRWRMLPLHAAIIFKSPFQVIEALVSGAPDAVHCKDDRGMLPLHLAFRHDASDEVIDVLITLYPESIETKDRKGRVPLQCANLKGKVNPRKLMEKYLRLAVAAERDKVAKEMKRDYDRKSEVLKGAYEEEVVALKKKLAYSETDVKSSRTACNAMLARVANMTDNVKSLNEEIEEMKQEKSQHENTISSLERKIAEINSVYGTKEQQHAEHLKTLEEKKGAIMTLEDKIEQINCTLYEKDHLHKQAMEQIAEKDNFIASLYDKIEKAEIKYRAKEEDHAVALLKLDEAVLQAQTCSNESSSFKVVADGHKKKTGSLLQTIENLTNRNTSLEEELERRDKKLEEQADWLNDINAVMDVLLDIVSKQKDNFNSKGIEKAEMMASIMDQDKDIKVLVEKDQCDILNAVNTLKEKIDAFHSGGLLLTTKGSSASSAFDSEFE